MTLNIGELIHHDRYRIDALLGKGGMGAVYKGWDLNLDIPVAIKENLETAPDAQKQFNREANFLARLSHPNLPRVTDYFIIPDQGQYLVMDYIEGEDLRSMMNRLANLPEPDVLAWIGQVADALAYLHAQKPPIIHRDIKPGNIRIRPDGRATLVDFGIAKIYDPSQATTSGAKAVTPGYSPPEQYGGAVTDTRADIYALGATLYHLLTGKEPPESVQRIVNRAVLQPPRELNESISPELEQVILKSTEIPTERRFQTMNELRKALTQPPAKSAAPESTPELVSTPEQQKRKPSRETVALPESELAAGTPPVARPAQAAPAPAPAAEPRKKATALPWVIAVAVLVGCVVLVVGGIAGYKLLTGNKEPTPEALSLTATVTQPAVVAGQPTVTAQAQASPTTPPSPSPAPASAPTSYTPVASLVLPSGETARGVVEKDGYAYILTKKSMLYIYDLTSMTSTQELRTYDAPASSMQLENGIGLLRHDNSLYVYGNAGIQVLNISDPARPAIGGSHKDLRVFNLLVHEDYLVAPGEATIALYDISDPSYPNLLSNFRVGEEYMNLAAAIYENMLYISEFSNINNKPKGLLKVYDFTDPLKLEQVQRIDPGESAYQLIVVEDKLLRCTTNDVELWDLTTKDNPQFKTAQRVEARACAFDRGNIIANGAVLRLSGYELRPLMTFDAKAGGDGLAESVFAQSESLPYGSYVNPGYVFLVQNGRVLVLAGNAQ